MRPKTDRCSGDEGATLVMVLAFMAAIGLVVMAVLSYSETSFKVSQTARDLEERTAAADGGLKWALDRLIADPTVCPASPADAPTTLAGAPATNGATPAITCSVREVTAESDGTGWAVFVDRDNGYISSDSGTGDTETKQIKGAVYNGGLGNRWDAPAGGGNLPPLEIEDGELLVNTASGGDCTLPDHVLLVGTSTFGCTNGTAASLPDSTQFLPFAPGFLPVRTASGVTDASDCTIFEPGYYPSGINLTTTNYLKSGQYLFTHEIVVAHQKVLGGMPPLSLDSTPVETGVLFPDDATISSEVPCALVDEPSERSGVQLIFGGEGWLRVDNSARFEIFSMAQERTPGKVVPGAAIYGVPADATGTWASFASTRHGIGATPADGDEPLFSNGEGVNARTVIHGGVYAPGLYVDLTAKNDGETKVLAGVVAGWVGIRSSANAISFEISSGETFTLRQYVLESVAPSATSRNITATALVRLPTETPDKPIISSWVVS